MKIEGVVDRIEGQWAVILLTPVEEYELNWPISLLPEDVKEGAVLQIEVQLEKKKTEERLKRAEDLIQRLKRRNE